MKKYAASIVLRLAYGKRTPTDYRDDIIKKIEQCQLRMNSKVAPSSVLINSLPWLKYLPGYLNEGKRWHQDELTIFSGFLKDVNEGLENKTRDSCFASWVMENQKSLDLTDGEIAYLCGNLFGAGRFLCSLDVFTC